MKFVRGTGAAVVALSVTAASASARGVVVEDWLGASGLGGVKAASVTHAALTSPAAATTPSTTFTPPSDPIGTGARFMGGNSSIDGNLGVRTESPTSQRIDQLEVAALRSGVAATSFEVRWTTGVRGSLPKANGRPVAFANLFVSTVPDLKRPNRDVQQQYLRLSIPSEALGPSLALGVADVDAPSMRRMRVRVASMRLAFLGSGPYACDQ